MEKIISHPRGAVYFVDINFQSDDTRGVQTGNRPCVVISSDLGNASSDSVIVALITSKDKAGKGINVPFMNWNGEENVVLCNQVHTVNKRWLTNKCFGMMPAQVMKEVDKQLAVALGISRNNVDISEITKAVNKIIELRKEEMLREKKPITQKAVTEIAEKLENLFVDVLVPMEKEAKQQQVEDLNKVAPVLTSFIESKTSEPVEQTDKKEETAEQVAIKEKALVEVAKALKPEKTTDKKEAKTEDKSEQTTKKEKRPKGFWTEAKMREYIHDKESMPLSELKDKWDVEKSQTAHQLYYSFRKKLGII